MTELSFLISLLLNEITPTQLKQIIADRIKEVEAKLQVQPVSIQQRPTIYNPVTAMQSPSTQAALEGQQEIAAPIEYRSTGVTTPIIASPAAAQALEARRQMMQEALSGPKAGQATPNKIHSGNK